MGNFYALHVFFLVVNLLMLVRVIVDNMVGCAALRCAGMCVRRKCERIEIRWKLSRRRWWRWWGKFWCGFLFYEMAFSLLIIFATYKDTHSRTHTPSKKCKTEEWKKPKEWEEKSHVRGFICWAFDLFAANSLCENEWNNAEALNRIK